MDADTDVDSDADTDADGDSDTDPDWPCDPGWAGASCEICVRFVAVVETSGDGLTWYTPYNRLSEGLDAASSAVEGGETICEVWVAYGWYFVYDDNPGDTLFLRPGVHVYGGFNGLGDEYLREQRDFVSNETVISGSDPDFTTGVFHVLWAESDTVAGSRLDGFTISGGNASGSDLDGQGGGLINYQETLQIENCIFDGNTAGVAGGAIANLQGNPSISRTVFRYNYAEGNGGALYNNGGQPHIENSIFWSNTASGANGGAIFNYSDSGDSPANAVITNCTFHANLPNAIYNDGASYPNIRNSAFWQNGMPQILDLGAASHEIGYSLIDDATGTNVEGDPSFVDAGAGDFHLEGDSACIDVADGDVAPESDFDGVARYDHPYYDGGVGDPPYVDIGAFEFSE